MCIRGTCKLLRRILDLSLAFATHFLQTIQNDCTCTTSGTRQNFILQGSLCILISSRYLNKYELIRQKIKKKTKKTLSHALNNWTEKGNSVHQPLYKTVAKIVSTDRHFETSLPPSTLGHNSKTKKVMKYEIKF